jgi:hypothetical protein
MAPKRENATVPAPGRRVLFPGVLEAERVARKRGVLELRPFDSLSREAGGEPLQPESADNRSSADLHAGDDEIAVGRLEHDVTDPGQPLAGDVEDLVVENVAGETEFTRCPGRARLPSHGHAALAERHDRAPLNAAPIDDERRDSRMRGIGKKREVIQSPEMKSALLFDGATKAVGQEHDRT